jgi:hypothetical protein
VIFGLLWALVMSAPNLQSTIAPDGSRDLVAKFTNVNLIENVGVIDVTPDKVRHVPIFGSLRNVPPV